MSDHPLNPIADAAKYENLGGVYFPILQQDGSRVMVKIGDGRDRSQFIFLGWLRQHDRMPGKVLS
jgi:hypothetical protein